MAESYNGWPAAENPRDIDVVPLIVEGVEFVGGVKRGDVHTVLGYVAEQFHRRVEPLASPGCWGWSYRQNRNANNLSCHSSGTAIDCNAPKHPNGVTVGRSFTPDQITRVHHILTSLPELVDVVHWGGDWTRANGLTPDSMHFEIHDHNTAKLARVADRIRNQEEDMPLTDADVAKIVDALTHAPVVNKNADGDVQGVAKLGGMLTNIESSQGKQHKEEMAVLNEIRDLLKATNAKAAK